MTFTPHEKSKILSATDWQSLLARSITTAGELAQHLGVDAAAVAEVTLRYPMRINPYYLSLIRRPGDPIWRQAVPDPREIEDAGGAPDPLAEEAQSPVPNLTHRYPDRVLFLVSGRCAVYCRHCMRKRKVGASCGVDPGSIAEGIRYIRGHRQVREVVLSGGDPLLLEDAELEDILARLRAIGHVEILRIHSRVPCTLPQRVTGPLVDVLRKFHPLFVNTHFNHPCEITPEASAACARLADAGIPLGCQTVLLRGVNDDPATMRHLMRRLLTIRVRPYYLHHPDPVRGTGHFRCSLQTGLALMQALRGHISGSAVPHYVVDLPGGGGKVPLLPDHLKSAQGGNLSVENYAGRHFQIPLAG